MSNWVGYNLSDIMNNDEKKSFQTEGLPAALRSYMAERGSGGRWRATYGFAGDFEFIRLNPTKSDLSIFFKPTDLMMNAGKGDLAKRTAWLPSTAKTLAEGALSD